MYQKYGEPVEGSRLAEAISSAVNLLSVTFAKVYFPTFSNGIKEIARYLGLRLCEEGRAQRNGINNQGNNLTKGKQLAPTRGVESQRVSDRAKKGN